MSDTRIRWTLGFKKNLGNYESLNIEASIEDYVRDGEKTSDASTRVYNLVEKELEARVDKVAKELKALG